MMYLFNRVVVIFEMLNVCENKNYIDKRVSWFVIFFCVMFNVDGSVFFIIVLVMFIVSIFGYLLVFGKVVIFLWVFVKRIINVFFYVICLIFCLYCMKF